MIYILSFLVIAYGIVIALFLREHKEEFDMILERLKFLEEQMMKERTKPPMIQQEQPSLVFAPSKDVDYKMKGKYDEIYD